MAQVSYVTRCCRAEVDQVIGVIPTGREAVDVDGRLAKTRKTESEAMNPSACPTCRCRCRYVVKIHRGVAVERHAARGDGADASASRRAGGDGVRANAGGYREECVTLDRLLVKVPPLSGTPMPTAPCLSNYQCAGIDCHVKTRVELVPVRVSSPWTILE